MKCLYVVLMAVLFTSSASWANCAWVLWRTYQPSLGEDAKTTAHSGFETREDCIKGLSSELARLEKALRETDPKVRITANAIIYHDDRQRTSISIFTCLPDTIDPRTPK
jgi:hypothetical protein